jgi:hypothetical protein
MLTSETITKITPALIKAQAAFKPAVKDAVNPAFSRGQNPKPSYVTLAQAIESVAEALRDNGIALVQQTDILDARTVLVTRLVHESGEWIAGRYPVHPVKADPQGEGSALTYARRYALMALVGIAPEDDDGNAAVKATQATVTRITPTDGVWDALDGEQQAFLQKVANAVLDLMPDADAAHAYLTEQRLETDEKAALWTRLDSKTRTALKKAHKEAA